VKKIAKNHQNFFFSLHKFSFVLFCLSFLIFWTETSFAATIKIGEINPLSGRFAKQGIEIHQGIEVTVAEANAAGVLAESRYRLFHEMTRAGPMWPSPELKNCAPGKKWRPLPAAMSIHWSVRLLQPKKKFKTKDVSYCRPIFFSLNFRSLLFVSSSDLLHCSGGTEN